MTQAADKVEAAATAGLGTLRGVVGKPMRIGAVTDQIATQGNETWYTFWSLGGAALGGVLLGGVASSDVRGAATGGLFAAGVAGLVDALLLGRVGSVRNALVSGLIGLGAAGTATYLAFTRR